MVHMIILLWHTGLLLITFTITSKVGGWTAGANASIRFNVVIEIQ